MSFIQGIMVLSALRAEISKKSKKRRSEGTGTKNIVWIAHDNAYALEHVTARRHTTLKYGGVGCCGLRTAPKIAQEKGPSPIQVTSWYRE